ncbi:hypothetical protein [Ahrensia sp. R2A130]|uniref:hypothetical protein n=1 Tax=Ahrensia sp. R2A130 TaxID=744979 RepID=UPI0001E0B4F3|nr:hypothetical protein [Ahrensia sp. R2A130]EFL88257.1 putative tRNA pseudouridine synthase C [Ahrensia sp. R2A130]
MAKMRATILDERYSGLAFHDHYPVVVPIRLTFKWIPWRDAVFAWAVVQPKREVFGSNVDWVWRHIAVFTEEDDARDFLERLNCGPETDAATTNEGE